MFTKEFIIEAAIQANCKEDAETVIRKMKSLGIINDDVTQKCNTIINNAKDFNKKALDYMYEFVPQELKEQLAPIRMITGAFATDLTGNASFNAEITLHRSPGTIHLKFDNTNKCLYYRKSDDTNRDDLLAQYLKEDSKFEAWIRIAK